MNRLHGHRTFAQRRTIGIGLARFGVDKAELVFEMRNLTVGLAKVTDDDIRCDVPDRTMFEFECRRILLGGQVEKMELVEEWLAAGGW